MGHIHTYMHVQLYMYVRMCVYMVLCLTVQEIIHTFCELSPVHDGIPCES